MGDRILRLWPRLCLLITLFGYGLMLQPRQVPGLTGTSGQAAFWSAALAVLAVAAVSGFVAEIRHSIREEQGE